MTRITLSLTLDEWQALRYMAENDLRGPKDQLRYLLLEEAKRRGLGASQNKMPATAFVAGD